MIQSNIDYLFSHIYIRQYTYNNRLYNRYTLIPIKINFYEKVLFLLLTRLYL